MVYAYCRVSSDKSTNDNQTYQINNYCKNRNIVVDKYFEETISGVKQLDVRVLGKIIKSLNKGDILIVAEISRLGRSMLMVLDILNKCLLKDVKVISIKENFEFGDNINSKVIAFAFGLSAEIERSMISARTKEALARLRAEGKILGRPIGRKSCIEVNPVYFKIDKIISLFADGYSQNMVAKKIGVHRNTLYNFCMNNGYEKLCTISYHSGARNSLAIREEISNYAKELKKHKHFENPEEEMRQFKEQRRAQSITEKNYKK